MRPRGAARAKGAAAEVGGTAADGIGQSQRRRVRKIVPDRRAATADARVFGAEEIVFVYWIIRRSLSSGGHSADPLAGDDSRHCGPHLPDPLLFIRAR